eukprot:8616543-Alexandrium_andersonii.AAC.1
MRRGVGGRCDAAPAVAWIRAATSCTLVSRPLHACPRSGCGRWGRGHAVHCWLAAPPPCSRARGVVGCWPPLQGVRCSLRGRA